PNTTLTSGRTGEPRLAAVASWAVLIASFALSASTWIAMAVLAGFTDTATLPFIDVTLKVAWLMPVAVDGYVVVALVLWMSPVPASVAEFAKKNTYGAAGIGIVAQSAYHLLSTLSATDQTWRVVLAATVGALPPAVAALAVHMRALIRRETNLTTTGSAAPTVSATPTVPVRHAPAPVMTPAPAPITATADTQPTDPPRPESPAAREVPTPAQVAARLTPAPASTPARPDADRPVSASTSKPRPTKPASTTTAPTLAAPATNTSVTEPEPAQLPLPYAVPADLLARADQAARQYRTEHGTPITAGQLAARLRVNSELAAQALAVLDLGPNTPTTKIPAVNGSPVKATR
ncbi:MAG TPA: hypothetical protein VFO77_13930, partial [Actinoplanes sp.]|nr:hypothetical protein [Actinoplanes sp.]